MREEWCGVLLGTLPQGLATASPVRAASHSVMFCACECVSKTQKMLYLFKTIHNFCIGIIT